MMSEPKIRSSTSAMELLVSNIIALSFLEKLMVCQEGLEPPAYCLEGSCPIRLGDWRILAERVGFEPTDPCRSPVFKTGSFNHSDISPC